MTGKSPALIQLQKERVQHFFEVYSRRIDFIDSLCSERNFERVLLCCCCIDSLGKYYCEAHGLGTGNQERFMTFLSLAQPKYPELDSVWITGLEISLRDAGETDLADYLADKCGANVSNLVWNENYDPDLQKQELEKRASQDLPKDRAERMKETATDFTYSKIIWRQYRNPSVHEGRFSHPWDYRNGPTPFTSVANTVGIEKGKAAHYHRVQLGVPPTFLVGCLRESFHLFQTGTTSSLKKMEDMYDTLRTITQQGDYSFRVPARVH